VCRFKPFALSGSRRHDIVNSKSRKFVKGIMTAHWTKSK